MSSNIFNIDYKRLVVLLLPTFMRKPVLFSLLKACVQPVVVLYYDFKANRENNLYRIKITPQVCYLRRMLNDSFDIDQRRIYIGNGQANEWTFIYASSLFNNTGGKQPLWASPADSTTSTVSGKTYSFNSENKGISLIGKGGAVGTIGIDFSVFVPEALHGIIDENRIKALLNTYKLASKRYAINYY